MRRLNATATAIVTLVSICTIAGWSPAASASAGTYLLSANEQLGPDERLVTPNGISLVMQPDGNLVEYAPGNRAVWASGTKTRDSVLRMQGDGNAVIIGPGNVPVWSTRTGGNLSATLELQTDGNLVVYAQGHAARWANGASVSTGTNGARDLAIAILANPRVVLQTKHVSKVDDQAHAKQNIIDTAAGDPAKRSNYGTAHGGSTYLDPRMLAALRQLGNEGGLRVSEIAGGSHNTTTSRHYSGRAFDIDQYGGRRTDTLVARCRQMGATLALFETNNHVHCEWT